MSANQVLGIGTFSDLANLISEHLFDRASMLDKSAKGISMWSGSLFLSESRRADVNSVMGNMTLISFFLMHSSMAEMKFSGSVPGGGYWK